MKELLTALVGKRCRIHTVEESLSYNTYTIKGITENGVLCEDKHGCTVIVNTMYISAVEEVKESAGRKKRKENESGQ